MHKFDIKPNIKKKKTNFYEIDLFQYKIRKKKFKNSLFIFITYIV